VTLHVPSPWRSFVEDIGPDSLCSLLTSLFTQFPHMHGVQSLVLNAFTCLVSVRRSLFSNEETRHNFMNFMMETQRSLINQYASGDPNVRAASGPGGNSRLLLDEQQLYHEFNRFLARFKYNFTLNDLIRSGNFENWLQSLYVFTCKNG
jgi:hypothetical protein